MPRSDGISPLPTSLNTSYLLPLTHSRPSHLPSFSSLNTPRWLSPQNLHPAVLLVWNAVQTHSVSFLLATQISAEMSSPKRPHLNIPPNTPSSSPCRIDPCSALFHHSLSEFSFCLSSSVEWQFLSTGNFCLTFVFIPSAYNSAWYIKGIQ